MTYEPAPYQITPEILNIVTAVAEQIGKLDGMNLVRPSPKLRRTNRIRAIHSSLCIKGNTLSLDQVTALLDKKRIIGPRKEILEVKTALGAYENLARYDPFSLDDLLMAHKTLMQGLVPNPGEVRKQPSGVIRRNDTFHEAPHWKKVPPLMDGLFAYLSEGRDHLRIKSCLFHYQLEYIHPFSDGNGRMGRLWQTRILMAYHPVFEYLPIEHMIIEHQRDYYDAQAKSDSAGDSTPFIDFMLLQIDGALEKLMTETRSVTVTPAERLAQFRSRFPRETFSRKDYQSIYKSISAATASRDLSHGLGTGLLRRTGEKRTAVYRFSK